MEGRRWTISDFAAPCLLFLSAVLSTNFRLTLWRSIQIFALLVLAVAKILYLRNLFESKRGV